MPNLAALLLAPSNLFPWPLLATEIEAPSPEVAPLVLAGVLLSLVVIFLASKIGGEICARINLPPFSVNWSAGSSSAFRRST